jgi:putative DNA primase/helicase
MEAIEFRSAIRHLIDRGFSVIPIPRGSKAPIVENWPAMRLTAENFAPQFRDVSNVGAIWGSPSSGAVDVDLDAPEAVAAASVFLPMTRCIYGRATRRRSHFVYRPTPEIFFETFELPSGMLVEIRAPGNGSAKMHQSVVPPSLHPSGELYSWESDGAPSPIDGAELRSAVRLVAIAAGLARLHPSFDDQHKNARHEYRLAVAGALARHFRPETARKLFRAMLVGAADPKTESRLPLLDDTLAKLAADPNARVTGLPTLKTLVDEKAFNKLRLWIDAAAELKPGAPRKTTVESAGRVHENRQEIHEESLGVRDMSDKVLSGRLGEICRRRLLDPCGLPISYSWIALVTAAGAMVPPGGANEMRTSLYSALVGPVGSGKSTANDRAM